MAADISHGAGTGTTGPPIRRLAGGDPVRRGWTPGRIAALAAGAVLIIASAVLLAGAGALIWAHQVQRSGYLTVGTATYTTEGYALASDPLRLPGWWNLLGPWASGVEIRVTAQHPGRPVMVAVAPAADVPRYLAGVSYTSVGALGDDDVTWHPGHRVLSAPTSIGWTAQAQGTGTVTLHWPTRSGDWTVLVMNPGGAPGLTVSAVAGVSSPVLAALAGTALAEGMAAGVLGAVLILIPVRLAAGSAGQQRADPTTT